MVVAVSAQTNPSNLGPPAGPILDLGGAYATPPTAALLVPGGGLNTYQQYTVNFTGTGNPTAITFAFREDPAYISFASASVVDLTTSSSNLLTNGDFSGITYTSNGNNLTPIGWTYANTYGVSEGGGTLQSGCGVGEGGTYGSGNCWSDGAVQAYDAISQTIPTIAEDVYQITFWVADNSGYSGDGGCAVVEGPCYFSDISTNGNTTTRLGNGINVTVYAQGGLPELPSQSQTGNVNPGQPEPTVFNFNGGFQEGSPTSGYDFTAQETNAPSNQAAEMLVTAIPQASQESCDLIVQANPLFSTAECFVYQNAYQINNLPVDAPVLFEVTCPGSPGGTCGSAAEADFFATLGTDFSFNCAENSPLGCGPTPAPFTFGFPNLTSTPPGLPEVGFLKGSGPDPTHPCSLSGGLNPPPLFQSNQIASFVFGDASGAPVRANSGGTGSCWVVTYLTPNEVPTVSITAPANGGTYYTGQAAYANYTCNAVTTVTIPNPNPPTGPYLTVASCTATDSPGGAVPDYAPFDTSTLGTHTFTGYVEDSATNTGSTTVTYNVQPSVPPATTSANYATFTQGTPGSFTITATGLPVPSISYSPSGSLPSGLSFVANANGTATISGTPTVSGLFTFWVIASTRVGTPALQSFSLTVNPPVSFAPKSISYGNVVVGQSAQNYVSLTNKSGKAVGIGPVTFTVTSGAKSQFSLGQACPATLQPGSSCAIGAVFTPSAAGTGAATLNIPTSVSSTPQSVSLSGSGINPQASFSPTSLSFGTIKVGKSSTLSVTLSNPGTTALAISSVSVSGTNAGNFVKSNACPSLLAASAKCTISVTFTPSATGARSAKLTVVDNAGTGTQTVPLSGTGD
jgi:hypothetical protein